LARAGFCLLWKRIRVPCSPVLRSFASLLDEKVMILIFQKFYFVLSKNITKGKNNKLYSKRLLQMA
jgi:hypothetical protein